MKPTDEYIEDPQRWRDALDDFVTALDITCLYLGKAKKHLKQGRNLAQKARRGK